jgi:glycosyltransferase involved in cell wall biosynthesis
VPKVDRPAQPVRVTVLTSHPIQYNAPLFKRLAQRPELKVRVLYCSSLGTSRNGRPIEGFGRTVVWDVDLLSGYDHEFLRRSDAADPGRRRSVLNPDVPGKIKRDVTDALVLFGWAYPSNWIAAAAARARRVPYILYSDTDVRDLGTLRIGGFRSVALRWLIRGSAGALYTGRFNRDFYTRYGVGPDSLWFSPLSVDNERFGSGSRAHSRDELGLAADTVYFLYVGRLIELKQPLELIAAVRQLQDRGENVGVIVAGSGPLDREVRAAAAGVRNSRVLGFVNQGRLPDIYAAADVLVLPSLKDARGTVVNEAMATGLPVVVSTGTGVWGPGDLVEDGRQGHVYEAGDQEGLETAMSLLLDPRRREAAGRAALEQVQSWDYGTAAAGWVDALLTVACSSSGK